MPVRWMVLIVVVMFAIAIPALAQAGADDEITINYFDRFVVDGGLITWCVLIPLSVVTVALILEHLLSIKSTKLLNHEDYDRLAGAVGQGDLAGAWRIIGENDHFTFAVLRRGMAELANSYVSAEYAIIEATEEQATKLLRKIEYLNIIGNISPMIGLLGTVYGIILAFNKQVEIVRKGGVTQPDQLAEGISIALVTTFWGLIVAIPALAVYGLLRNRIDALAAQIANMALDVIRAVKPEQRESLRKIVDEATL